MALSAPSKLYADDVSLVVVLLDVNPFFWASASANASTHQPVAALSFSKFLNHVLPFLNSILLVNQLNHVVVIAAGVRSCGYIYDSGGGSDGTRVPDLCQGLLRGLEEFVETDRQLSKDGDQAPETTSSLLSGSLALALCCIHTKEEIYLPLYPIQDLALAVLIPFYFYSGEKNLTGLIDIQRIFRSGTIHPQPRILCLQGSPDGPEQYVAVMNAIFSAQRSMIPIDSCVVGIQHSAFLQQASHITGGIYLKPQQLDGLFQYLSMVFATDLQSRSFLQLPKPAGVDFRASCFCHKQTIDRGYVCSVCLSIFCKPHKKCSTCGSDFKQACADSNSKADSKRKAPGA